MGQEKSGNPCTVLTQPRLWQTQVCLDYQNPDWRWLTNPPEPVVRIEIYVDIERAC
jgi:hypothetical protein